MEFKHIEYFLEASRHTSMSKAAGSLYISQQALSRCIHNLEEELGCRLFTRTAQGSTLTEEGKYLYEKFAPIADAYRRAEEEAMDRLSARPHRITVASSPMIFSVLDPELLYSFREAHPNIDLDIREMPDHDADAFVYADPSHLAIVRNPEDPEGVSLEQIPVYSEPLYLCVHRDHPLASREEISFGELAEEKFLSLDRSSHYQALLDREAEKFGFHPNYVFESADVNQICALVNQGRGIYIAADDPSFGTLYRNIRVIPLAEQDLFFSIAFIFQDAERLEPQALEFVRFIQSSQSGS